MTELAYRRMSADEFIAWAMEQPRGRFELACGEVVPMPPGNSIHTRVKGSLARRLAEEVERGGLGCSVYPDGMAVQIDGRTVYHPDALLRHGPELPDDAVRVLDPLVIVEVRSRSLIELDSGLKLLGYFRFPSLRHYVIVLAEDRAGVHHERRGDGDGLTTHIIRDGGPVALDPPGIVLRDLFPAS
ncbi:MAG: Uma2 family endonuclease [Alphaproteobacteria bacterium]|nr:Uma2 family endonuclease [Alphaproteobacteria bacterium]